MKNILTIMLLVLWVGSCRTNSRSNDVKDETHNNNLVDSSYLMILQKKMSEHILFLDYESNNQWKVQDKHCKFLYKWIKEFKNDNIINQLPRQEIEKSFIIHIEAGMTQDLSLKTARKRLEDLRKIVTDLLGLKEYDIEVFKVLTNLKYKKKHDIEITIKRLLY